MSDRLLIRGGHVLTLDASLGDFSPGDVLVENGRIAAVGPRLRADAGEVVDATGRIVLPGFVDTHRHTWQTALRGVCADWTLLDYFRGIRLNAAGAFRPEDVRTGNLAGALEALSAGVTTILDFSHCVLTPQHADAAIEGLRESGIRAVFAYGYYAVPVTEPAFAGHADRVDDARRVRVEHFPAEGGLVTMGIALTELGFVPFEDTRSELTSARELDLLVTAHTGAVSYADWPGDVELLAGAGLLDAGQVHVHCNACTERELQLLAAAGCSISVTPETELQMGMGWPVSGRALACGLRPSLGCDIVSNQSGDLLTQMRIALQVQRALDNATALADGRMPEQLSVGAREALRWATIDGARAIGLDGQIGSLTPGKAADLIVVRANRLSMLPLHDPVAAVVLQARPEDVETVLVDGRLRKADGRMLDVDASRATARLDESAAYLLGALEARGGLLPPAPEGFLESVMAASLVNVGRGAS